MKGGKVLIVKTRTTVIENIKKKINIKTIEFLFNGEIYSESVDNFKAHAIYIGDTTKESSDGDEH